MSLKKDGFEIKGYDELMLQIENLGKSADREVGKALRSSAEILKKGLEKNTPDSLIKNPRHPNARHNVVITNVKTNKDTGAKYITVGYSGKHPNDVSWRIHFVEFGSIRQRPQLFMEKTINETKDKVRNEIMKHLKKGLNLK